MRSYLYALAAYFAISLTVILVALSDVLFGGSGFGTFARRVGLAVVWPIAVLSRAGRKFLFNTGGSDHANSGGVEGGGEQGTGAAPQDH